MNNIVAFIRTKAMNRFDSIFGVSEIMLTNSTDEFVLHRWKICNAVVKYILNEIEDRDAMESLIDMQIQEMGLDYDRLEEEANLK